MGNIGAKSLNVGLAEITIMQGESRIPGLGDDPVRAQIIRQIMGEGNQCVAAFRSTCTVGGNTDPLFIDPPYGAVKYPAICL